MYAPSAGLRVKGAEVVVADTGRRTLDLLSQHRDVHAVRMDIMMPEMFDAAELLAKRAMGLSPGGTHAN